MTRLEIPLLDRQFWSPREIEQITGLSHGTIAAMIKDGRLPSIMPEGTRCRMVYSKQAKEVFGLTPPANGDAGPPAPPPKKSRRWGGKMREAVPADKAPLEQPRDKRRGSGAR